MKLSFEGWARSHGQTNVISKKLSHAKLKSNGPYNQQDIYIEPYSADGPESDPDRIKLKFFSQLRFNGSYQGELDLSRDDIERLFCLLAKGSSYGELTKRLAALVD